MGSGERWGVVIAFCCVWGGCGVRGRGAYFAWFLRVWYFCLGASRIVILKENGIVNGVVKEYN